MAAGRRRRRLSYRQLRWRLQVVSRCLLGAGTSAVALAEPPPPAVTARNQVRYREGSSGAVREWRTEGRAADCTWSALVRASGRRADEIRGGVALRAAGATWVLGSQTSLESVGSRGWSWPLSRRFLPAVPAPTVARSGTGLSLSRDLGGGVRAGAAAGRTRNGQRAERMSLRLRGVELGWRREGAEGRAMGAFAGAVGGVPLQAEGVWEPESWQAQVGLGGGGRTAGGVVAAVERGDEDRLAWRAAVGLRVRTGAWAGSRAEIRRAERGSARCVVDWRGRVWRLGGTATIVRRGEDRESVTVALRARADPVSGLTSRIEVSLRDPRGPGADAVSCDVRWAGRDASAGGLISFASDRARRGAAWVTVRARGGARARVRISWREGREPDVEFTWVFPPVS